MRKGFTLIELLAVILILGIIALIAVPQVTNVIENANKGSVEVSAKHYLDAITNTIALNKLDQDSTNDIADGKIEISSLKGIKVTGETPETGKILVENGEIKTAAFILNGYNIDCNSKGNCIVTKGSFRYTTSGIINSNSDKLRPVTRNTYIKALFENNVIKEQYICIYTDLEFCETLKELNQLQDEIKNYFGYDSSWELGANNYLYKDLNNPDLWCDMSGRVKCSKTSVYMSGQLDSKGNVAIYTGDAVNGIKCGYTSEAASCWKW